MGEERRITRNVTGAKSGNEKNVKVMKGRYQKGNKLVLLIDDEQSILVVGERMLKFLGFDVLTASDGRESLKVFEENSEDIDCVLLDVGLPNLTGEEVFGSIRRLRPDVKIILCSGHSLQDATSNFDKTERLDGFIQKPYTLAILEEKLMKAIEN